MLQYLNMLETVLTQGEPRKDRTGTGTRSIFGHQASFDLSSFPLLTTKKLHWRSIVYELIWMLSGNTNVNYLKENGVSIWDEWADENGDLGPVYGHQWRSFNDEYDQIKALMNGLRNDPVSRRHIVSAWNPSHIDEMKLPPCHVMFQMYVRNDGKLDCHMYQRSADIFLGVPFNIASYALLTYIIAQCNGNTPGRLIISYGDLHLYENHVEQAKLQLTRNPNRLPTLNILNPARSIESFQPKDFVMTNYHAHPNIPAEVSK